MLKVVGGAAGIGSGTNSFVGNLKSEKDATPGKITIKDEAKVTSKGGNCTELSEYNESCIGGGAGIGKGASVNFDNPFGTIEILGKATVTAISGQGAQAIGYGKYFTEIEESVKEYNNVIIDNDGLVVAINLDTKELPINKMITPLTESEELTQKINYPYIFYNYKLEDNKLIYFNGDVINSELYKYNYNNNSINIYRDDQLFDQITYSGNLGNFAIIKKVNDEDKKDDNSDDKPENKDPDDNEDIKDNEPEIKEPDSGEQVKNLQEATDTLKKKDENEQQVSDTSTPKTGDMAIIIYVSLLIIAIIAIITTLIYTKKIKNKK